MQEPSPNPPALLHLAVEVFNKRLNETRIGCSLGLKEEPLKSNRQLFFAVESEHIIRLPRVAELGYTAHLGD
jgi:hypothetical protein